METETILQIAIGVVLFFGFVFSILFAMKKSYRDPTAAFNYERIRNSLTLRKSKPEPEKEEVDEEDEDEGKDDYDYTGGGGGGILASIIGGAVTIMVGVSLIGPITSVLNSSINMTSSANNESIAPTTEYLMHIVPYIFTAAIIFVAVATIFNALNRSGVI